MKMKANRGPAHQADCRKQRHRHATSALQTR
jgi:hypothetical protein